MRAIRCVIARAIYEVECRYQGLETAVHQSRTMFYGCAVGECDYLEQVRDDGGKVITVPGESLDVKKAKAMGL